MASKSSSFDISSKIDDISKIDDGHFEDFKYVSQGQHYSEFDIKSSTPGKNASELKDGKLSKKDSLTLNDEESGCEAISKLSVGSSALAVGLSATKVKESSLGTPAPEVDHSLTKDKEEQSPPLQNEAILPTIDIQIEPSVDSQLGEIE